ncbi:unnamed protein product [Lymnaea stagnalis]|uniref:Sodium-coupled monocarboxylate transporter 1 n=1 Tax=Lymnaea stagnalis TaxID=6523 RepID=A0AAV2H863_LYMST
MMHLYIMDLFGHLKGLPGAFVGCFILASLSALTIALNAVATILYKDIYQRSKRSIVMSETTFKRIIIVLADGLSMFMGFVVSTPPALLQTFYTFNSVIAGPFLGVFVLGMFFPWANNLGTFIGAVLAFILNCWIGFGGMINHVATAVKSPVSDLACYYNVEHFRNLTTSTNGTTPAYVKMTYPPVETYDGPEQISMLSYMYLAPVGTVVTVIVSLVVSFISGYVRPSSLDPKLICPIFDVVFPFLPECVLRPLRFGIDHKEKYTKTGSSAQPTTVSHTEPERDISELSGNNITTNGHVNLALEPDDYDSSNGPTHHRPTHPGPTHDGPAHHETNRPFHLKLEAVRLSNGGGKDSQAVFLIENDSRASVAHLNDQFDSRASMADLNDQLDSRASLTHLNHQLVTKL